ncbi:MAG: phosphotransferase [Alphaproteobacteria bacterium]|nr:phosphotransferase [Alphaproteobacteria bacterium]
MITKDEIQSWLESEFPNAKIKFAGEGWHSAAFMVDDKVFRFPKNPDNIKKMRKEKELTDFIRNKVPLPIPAIEIFEDVKYPHSMHKAILGNTWKNCDINNLCPQQRQKFINDYVDFVVALHSIDINDLQKNVPSISTNTKHKYRDFDTVRKYIKQYFTDEELNHFQKIWDEFPDDEPETLILVHQDFGGQNSLIDENYRLTGVFDFGNSCISSTTEEFFRLYEHGQESLLKDILNEYEQRVGTKVNIETLKTKLLIDMIQCPIWLYEDPGLASIKDKEIEKIISLLRNWL